MYRKPGQIDGYDYYITQDSDEEFQGGSSDEEEKPDDVGLLFDGTAQQKRHAFQRLASGLVSGGQQEQPSSSEDEFEEMMKSELDNTVNEAEKSWFKTKEVDGATVTAGTSKMKKEEEDKNDELLYDPQADEDDQKWMDEHRAKIKKRVRGQMECGDTTRKTVQKPMKSDAILNCPACMTTLCLDCQRHSSYQNQFRAMFVLNCNVQTDEKLHFKSSKKKVFKRHRKRAQREQQAQQEEGGTSSCSNFVAENGGGESEWYHPVKCQVCSTEVGVYDTDEVYHFFNVLTSSG